MNKEHIMRIEKLGDESQYKEQAEYFLSVCGVHFEVVKAVPQDAPEWWAQDGKHGIKYSITLAKIKDGHTLGKYDTVSNQPHSFSEIIHFMFWDSIPNKEKASQSIAGYSKPTAYDVLAVLDSMDNDTFEDWCMNYGYDDDSHDAYKTYQRCIELDVKLKKVFTSEELNTLQYIN